MQEHCMIRLMTSRKPRLQIQLLWRKQKVIFTSWKPMRSRQCLKHSRMRRQYEDMRHLSRLQFHQHRRQLLLKRNRRYRHSLRDLISQMEVRTHSAVMKLMSRQLRQWISLRQNQLKILKMSRQMLISPLMKKFRQQVIPLSVNLQKQSWNRLQKPRMLMTD